MVNMQLVFCAEVWFLMLHPLQQELLPGQNQTYLYITCNAISHRPLAFFCLRWYDITYPSICLYNYLSIYLTIYIHASI